ncbi:MAG: hypothetical protein FD188_507 [Ignavibacteria bacterium]|nr:MAG: hypothetical protein FD188_507 [Ignavibacteria bacterium]
MKRLLLLIIGIIVVTLTSNVNYGKVWRVDMNSANNPDFTNIQAAVNDTKVAAGDTIYLAGHPTTYGNLTLEKRVTIIGNGYFLSENNYKYENIFSSKLSTLIIIPGAGNSVIRSIEIQAPVAIRADGIIFDRNYVKNGGIHIENSKNCLISRSYFSRTGNTYVLYIGFNSQNITVKNNYFDSNGSQTFRSETGSCTLINNVFSGHVYLFAGGVFLNNIIISQGFYTGASADVRGNFSAEGSMSSYPGNQFNVSWTSLCLQNSSPDGKYQLKEGSMEAMSHIFFPAYRQYQLFMKQWSLLQ